MTDISEERIDDIAERVDSEPGAIGDDALDLLLDGVTDDDFSIHSPAGDALEDLVEAWSDEEIDARFDADRLRGRLATDEVNAGYALSAVIETLSRTSPGSVRDLRPELREGVGEQLRESTVKEALCAVLDTETELVSEAELLIAAESATARNLGVRIVGDVAGGGYEIDEAHPDAVESVLPAVWEVLKNDRERRKPRENAAETLASHAAERPEMYVDRVGELADVVRDASPHLRYDLYKPLETIAEHDPDAVAWVAPLVNHEFDDHTAFDTNRRQAIELLATLVETHPSVIRSLEPYVDRIEDDSVTSDGDAAAVVAAVGGVEHLDTLFGARDFDTQLVSDLLADTSEPDLTDALRPYCTHDDPGVRGRAVQTVREEFHESIADPASVYLDRLGDDAEGWYSPVEREAVEGLERVAEEDPDRLLDETEPLFSAAESAVESGGYSSSGLAQVLADLALVDEDIYARVVDDLDADDDRACAVAVNVLSRVATAYPPGLDDPVPSLLELYGDDERESVNRGAICNALGGLAYVRPDAVAPVADEITEWYEADEDLPTSMLRDLVADLAPRYPEVPAALAERLAADYADGYDGDYAFDYPSCAIALGHAARVDPGRVRDVTEELFERDADGRPPSLPLVSIGLGDWDAVPPSFTDEGGWLTDFLVDTDDERHQLRLAGLLGATSFEPARDLLETVVGEAAVSEVARSAAADALDRLE